MATKLNLFNIDGELMTTFSENTPFKVGNKIYDASIQDNGLLRLCNIIKNDTRDEVYKRAVDKITEELSQRRQDVKDLDRDLYELKRKIAKGNEDLGSEMDRLINIQSQHERRIKEIHFQVNIPVTYEQKSMECFVFVEKGIFMKLPWFPKLVMWNEEVECKTDTVSKVITEKMPLNLPELSTTRNTKREGEGEGEKKHDSFETNSTLVPNEEVFEGHLYAVGGYNKKESLVSVEKYDPKKDKWVSMNSMSKKRHKHALITFEGQLYAIAGSDKKNRPNPSVERFDPEKNKWSSMQRLANKRTELKAAVLNGYIYAVGGKNTVPMQLVERYEPSNNKWIKCKPMTYRRHRHGVAVVAGELFVIGGRGCANVGALASVERYDPELDEWTEVASMRNKREGLGVAVLNGQVYAVGGFSDAGYLKTVERYNPDLNTWTDVPPMQSQRAYLAVAAIGGQLYAAGGQEKDKVGLASVERYDPEEKKWTFITPMPSGKYDFGLSAVGL